MARGWCNASDFGSRHQLWGELSGDADMIRKAIFYPTLITVSIVIAAFCHHYADAQTKAMKAGPAQVDAARLVGADNEPGNWMSYSRNYNEQRFSPLDQINAANAGSLKLAWYYDLDTARGQEATPLVVDGVMYTSTAWSLVKALDAKTGRLLWSYDPKVPREILIKICCDAVNRGVAVWKGKVFVGTLDGRLIARDAADLARDQRALDAQMRDIRHDQTDLRHDYWR